MIQNRKNNYRWWLTIWILVIVISILHYTTPTMKWQYHLIFMQSYFIPILLAAFQFGIRGGLGTAIGVSILYFPHIMLQWGGLVEANLIHDLLRKVRFMESTPKPDTCPCSSRRNSSKRKGADLAVK